MLRASHVACVVSRRLSCTLRESERFRASKPVKDPWETTCGAETRLEHCAWSPSAPRLLGAGSTNKKRGLKGALGGWVVAWARGRVGWRARWGCEGGCVASGHGARVGKVGPPRGCSPRGRAGSVWLEGVPCSPFAHARLRFFLGPQDQRARDDRPRTHGHAVAAARE